jgi:hypothetical protein
MDQLSHSVSSDPPTALESVVDGGPPNELGMAYGPATKIELSWQEVPGKDAVPSRMRVRMFVAAGLLGAAAVWAIAIRGLPSVAGSDSDPIALNTLAPALADAQVLPPAFVQPDLLRMVVDQTASHDGEIVEPDAPPAVAAPLQLRASDAVVVLEEPPPEVAPVAPAPLTPARASVRRESTSKSAANRSWTGSFFERQN